jgi:uncharacterized damage-inducible protein DinB
MISQALLPEFDYEFAATRKTLERIPEDKFAWKPHEKSMALGALSQHLAEIPHWTVETISKDFIDLAGPYARAELKTRQEILDAFNRNVAEARASIERA